MRDVCTCCIQFLFDIVCISMRNKKIRLYLAEVHIITLIRDIGLANINSPNHLPYNSVYTAFYCMS